MPVTQTTKVLGPKKSPFNKNGCSQEDQNASQGSDYLWASRALVKEESTSMPMQFPDVQEYLNVTKCL